MRHVFGTTNEVAHVWASQTQERGENGRRSAWFNGTAFYSYATPIAAIHTDANEKLVLVTCNSFSVTTNGKHIPAVRRAMLGTPSVDVRHVHPISADDHAQNMVEMQERKTEYELKSKRARSADMRDMWQDSADKVFRDTMAYTEFFKLPHTFDINTLRAEMDVRRAERWARQQADNLWRAAESRLTMAEKLEKWLRGEGVYVGGHPDTFLRVTLDGTKVETSRGAFVPIDAARAVWTAWKDGTLKTGSRVGIYEYLDSTPDEIIIGCHTITRTIADAFATSQGWAE